MAGIADAGMAPDVAIRANLAIFPNHHVTLNINAWEDATALTDMNCPIQNCRWMQGSANNAFRQIGDEVLMGAQQIPWVMNDKGFGGSESFGRIRGTLCPHERLTQAVADHHWQPAASKGLEILGSNPSIRMDMQARAVNQCLLMCRERDVADWKITQITRQR